MPKLKSKSSAKKRFKTTASGKVRFKHASSGHLLTNKEKSAKLRNRGTGIMFKGDADKVLDNWLHYPR